MPNKFNLSVLSWHRAISTEEHCQLCHIGAGDLLNGSFGVWYNFQIQP